MENKLFRLLKSYNRKEWEEDHVQNWKNFLELNDSDFSAFQKALLYEIESVLKDFGISYKTEITEYTDLNDKRRKVKMIKLTSNQNSSFWVYPDMAELEVGKKHEVYEQFGYLEPVVLINEYVKSARKLLMQKNL